MKNCIEFPSQIENISIIENLIDQISEIYNLDAIIYGNILVSLVEGVSNAIIHGNKCDINKNVHIEYNVADDYVVFTVADEGEGFDFTSIPDPTANENIDKPHGRGVFLMNKLADELHFYRSGAEIEVRFKLKK